MHGHLAGKVRLIALPYPHPQHYKQQGLTSAMKETSKGPTEATGSKCGIAMEMDTGAAVSLAGIKETHCAFQETTSRLNLPCQPGQGSVAHS